MKKYLIGILIAAIVLGIIFIPKYLSEGDGKVRFRVVESNEVPEKLKEVLPKYLPEERALSCRVDDEIYVVVTRGEKRTDGYSIDINKIEKTKKEDGKFEITVFAKYKDPNPNQIVPQIITYPFVVAKTDLSNLPNSIQLEVEYEE